MGCGSGTQVISCIVIIILLVMVIGYLLLPGPSKDSIINTEALWVNYGKLQRELEEAKKTTEDWKQQAAYMNSLMEQERARNNAVISQKKSSEVRLGQVTENIVPFLENCRHNPKNMHFLGMPIDYLVIDFEQGEITFLEVKTGNAKESRRQKLIKNIIKSGKVYYETMRVNDKGVIVSKAENLP